jgi:hypothetical protein
MPKILNAEGQLLVELPGDSFVGAMLASQYLKGAQLVGLDLSGANFDDANLEGANLSSANLSNATLTKANLSGSNLQDVTAVAAVFDLADLDSASAMDANFVEASFSESRCTNALFCKSDFSSATLNSTDFSNSSLKAAEFNNSKLTEVLISGADVRGIDFSKIENVEDYVDQGTEGEHLVVHKNKFVVSGQTSEGKCERRFPYSVSSLGFDGFRFGNWKYPIFDSSTNWGFDFPQPCDKPWRLLCMPILIAIICVLVAWVFQLGHMWWIGAVSLVGLLAFHWFAWVVLCRHIRNEPWEYFSWTESKGSPVYDLRLESVCRLVFDGLTGRK